MAWSTRQGTGGHDGEGRPPAGERLQRQIKHLLRLLRIRWRIRSTSAGRSLFTGDAWARVVAVVLAALNAVAQLAYLSVYPVSCVVVIWAVIVHGTELQRQDAWWPAAQEVSQPWNLVDTVL